jgi:hypothetical protein
MTTHLIPVASSDQFTALAYGSGVDRTQTEAGPVVAFLFDDSLGRVTAAVGVTSTTSVVELADGICVDLSTRCYWPTRAAWAEEMAGQPLASIVQLDPTPKRLEPEWMLLVNTPSGGWALPKASRAEALAFARSLNGDRMTWRLERRLCTAWEVDTASSDQTRGARSDKGG